MIDNFLRPPRGLGELVADALRICGVLSVVLAAVLFELTDAGILAFALPGLVAPRFIGMTPWSDILVSATLLLAAWSNVGGLYTTIPWWDLVVHFVCAGVLAMGCYLFLARLGMVAVPFTGRFTPVAGVALTSAFGLALGALWEMVEWFGYTYITPDIHVTYEDTIGDMAAGGLGALCLGFLVAYVPVLRSTRATPEGEPAQSEEDRYRSSDGPVSRDGDAGSATPLAFRATRKATREKDLPD